MNWIEDEIELIQLYSGGRKSRKLSVRKVVVPGRWKALLFSELPDIYRC